MFLTVCIVLFTAAPATAIQAIETRLAPRLWCEGGCSGSSISGLIAKDMIESLVQVKTFGGGNKDPVKPTNQTQCRNEGMLKPVWESFKPQKNCFGSLGSSKGTISPKEALQTLEAVQSFDAVLLAKANVNQLTGKEMSEMLTSHGARIVSAVRSNALDHMVCQTRDCFGGVVHGQHPVDAYTGKKSNLCFIRRKVELEGGNGTMALLNKKLLVKGLKKILNENNRRPVLLAKAFPQMRIAHVTYENLTAFEWMGGKGLEISTRAWWEVMASFGFEKSVSLDSVHDYLSKSDMFGSRPPPKKHADVIWNIADVRKTILATGDASLIALLRL